MDLTLILSRYRNSGSGRFRHRSGALSLQKNTPERSPHHWFRPYRNWSHWNGLGCQCRCPTLLSYVICLWQAILPPHDLQLRCNTQKPADPLSRYNRLSAFFYINNLLYRRDGEISGSGNCLPIRLHFHNCRSGRKSINPGKITAKYIIAELFSLPLLFGWRCPIFSGSALLS